VTNALLLLTLYSRTIYVVPNTAGPASEKAILRLSDDSGSLTLTDVPFSKTELHSQDVFLVNDRGLALYIWVGADASKDERSKAFQYANQYISKNKLPMSTPVSRVLQGQTTASFEAVFA
jgi:Gelsolin repeat